MPVSRVMTRHPVTIDPDDTLWAALNTLLASGLRHLVVADQTGRCRGILSDRYVVAEWPLDAIGSHVTHVRQMLDRDDAQIGPANTVADAAQLMLDTRTDALAVVDPDGRVVGVVTGSDLLRALAEPGPHES
jgi:CBS domain-containing protein